MRRLRLRGNFFLCLLVNLLLNIEGIVPAVVLLVLHFVLDISLWWALGAFGLWILIILMLGLFMGWAARCGNEPEIQKENKNPYSKN